MTRNIEIEEASVAATQELLGQCEYETECLEAMATVFENVSALLRAFVEVSIKGTKAYAESDR